MGTNRIDKPFGVVVMAVVVSLCIAAIVFLALEIARDLRLLNSANSDNVQWTLAQAEVEFLEFQHAVDEARESDPSELSAVRREFDIAYSRLRTLATGALYSDLRARPEFSSALYSVYEQMDAMIPAIDGPDPALADGLSDIAATVTELRPLVRQLANDGLHVFARQSDARREGISVTLTRLAILTTALVVALIYLLRHSRQTRRAADQRRADLASAYSRLNTVLETSLDAVIVANTDGEIMDFNAAAEKIFRYAKDEVLGKSIADIIIPDHLREAHMAGMERHRKTGEKHVVGHGRVRLEAKRRNGEVFPVELALETAQTDEQELVIGFLRDISQRVAAENELIEARDRALAGEKAKAEFLAMMTHEIRTPLNGMLGNLSLLQDSKLSGDQSRYVKNMDISGKLLMSHVDSVLDIARFESGATEINGEAVHLGRLVQDIVDSQVSPAEKRGNTLSWRWVGSPVGWVETDGSRLQQVILNLLGNAIKFTHGGKITIELEVVASDDGEQIEVRIIDTGIGVAEEDQERIFEDFQTTNSLVDEAGGGTGLGLGIARRFVRAMGGHIGIESGPGEGSVFWFTLPLVHAAEPAKDTQSHAMATPVAPAKILVVEDNEINLRLTEEILTRLGHNVTEARNGQEGVEQATKNMFDLILMDIRMPVMDGVAATKAIRAGSGPCKDAPIVALSANVLPEAKDRLMAQGLSGFLGKPLEREELDMVLQKFCGAAEQAPRDTFTSAPSDPIAGLIARHVAETKELFDWLGSAPTDVTEIAERCHKVAGSAAAFGQADLRECLVAVENVAEARDMDGLTNAIAKARKAWADAPEPSVG